MKRIFSILLILVLVGTLCACGRSGREYETAIPQEAATIDFSNSVTIVSSPTPAPTEAPVFTPELPATTPTPVPAANAFVAATPTPTIVIVNTASNPITKSPGSDVVEAGGTVKFVAAANNYSSVSWKIKLPSSKTNPSSANIFNATNAPSHFPGLGVSGEYTTTLTLSNVPAEMDQCLIQCVFSCNGTDYFTNNATLTVINSDPVKVMANSCLTQWASLAGKDYTSSALQNYSVDANGKATFDITFASSSYTVVGEFVATDSYFLPVHAVVYQGSTIIGQRAITSGDPTSEFRTILSDPGAI